MTARKREDLLAWVEEDHSGAFRACSVHGYRKGKGKAHCARRKPRSARKKTEKANLSPRRSPSCSVPHLLTQSSDVLHSALALLHEQQGEQARHALCREGEDVNTAASAVSGEIHGSEPKTTMGVASGMHSDAQPLE